MEYGRRKPPWKDWEFSINGSYRKPLTRQLSEFSEIRKAKSRGIANFNGKEIKVSKLFNSKEEWFSHISHWDVVR